MASSPGGLTPRALLAGSATALFVLRPLYPSESAAVEGDGLPVVMLWLLLLAFWAILAARGSVQRIRFTWPDVALGALVLWHSVAALWAVAYGSPRPALNMLWEWLGLGIAFFLARQSFQTGLQRRAVGAVMIALAVVVSTYGLYQYFVELPATRAFYEQEPDEMLRDAGLWFPPGSPEREAFKQRLESLEPMATFALTNSLAGFVAPWAIVAAGISMVFARRLDGKQRGGIAAPAIVMGLCLLLTKSRSAYLAVLCGGAGLVALWWIGRGTTVQMRRGILAVAIAIVLLVVAVVGAVAVGGLDAEVLSEAPKSLGYRVQYWQSSWEMIRDMPVVGCGPGNFQHRYMAYKLPEASEEIADPHNFVVEIWATAGTPAMLALLAFFLAFAVCMARSSRTRANDLEAVVAPADGERGDEWSIYAGAFFGMILSIPVGALSEAPPNWMVPLSGLLLGAAVLAVLRPWVDHGEDSPWLWTCAAAVLLIHLLFAGGIAYPGVAGGLWLLLALALAVRDCGDRPVSPRAGGLVLVVTIALIAACYFTGYQPTLVSRLQIQRAYAGVGDPRERLREAAAADRWGFKPRRHLAELMHQQWLEQRSERAFEEFERAVQEALDRAPYSAKLRHLFGMAYRDCFNRSHDSEHLAKGIALLESSISLYPNSCRNRANLAETYLLAGDQDGYERERDEALRLDSLTPHWDKKLRDEQRQSLLRNEVAPEVRAATLE